MSCFLISNAILKLPILFLRGGISKEQHFSNSQKLKPLVWSCSGVMAIMD